MRKINQQKWKCEKMVKRVGSKAQTEKEVIEENIKEGKSKKRKYGRSSKVIEGKKKQQQGRKKVL